MPKLSNSKKISLTVRNKRENIKNFLLYLVRSYGLSILSIIHIFLLLKLISIDIYGKIQYINAIIAAISILTLTGAETSLIQNTALGKEYLFTHILKFRLLFSLIPASLMLGIGCSFYFDDQQLSITLCGAGILLPLIVFRMITSLYIGRKDFKTSMKIDISAKIFSVCSSIIIAFLFPQNLIMLYLIPFSSEIFIYFVGYMRSQINKNAADTDLNHIKNEYIYVLKRTGTFIVPVVSARLDKIIIGSFFSFSELAFFSVAKFCVEQLKLVTQAIQKIYLQKYSSRPISEIVNQASKVMLSNFFALFIFALIVDIGAVVFINLLLYEKYAQTIPYIHIFLAGGVTVFAANYFILKWIVARSVKKENIFYIISTVGYLLIVLVLSPLYGIKGLVVAAAGRPLIYTLAAVFVDKFFYSETLKRKPVIISC